jgi:hypothetical protein
MNLFGGIHLKNSAIKITAAGANAILSTRKIRRI